MIQYLDMKTAYTLLGLTLGIALNTQAQNVGVNTDGSTPDSDAILHVKNHGASGKDSTVVRIENEQNGANDVTGLELYNSGTGATARWDVYIPASGSTDLRFKNNGTDRITIQNDGDVGIGTTSPVSGLDIQSSMGYKVNTITSAITLDNTHNVVLCNTGPYTVTLPPAASNTGRVYYIKNDDVDGDVITIDGNASETINGSTTYDLDAYTHVVQIISDGTNWHIIEEANNNTGAITSALDCGSSTDNGTLQIAVAASGVSSDVPYTGGDCGTHSGQTVTSTGVTGLTAALSAGNFACGDGTLTYNITGTPASSGTASFTLEIGGQTCTLQRTVITEIATLDCAGATDNGTLTDGEAASGVSSEISYTGGNGGAHSGQVVTSTGVTGLTATLSAGTFASGAGTLTYNITGTPSGDGTASFAINIGGQTCTLDRTVDSSDPCAGVTSVTFTYNGASVTYGTISSSTGKCWLDRNLGASQVATSSTDHLAYGDLFQWGRGADGHQLITWTNSTTGTVVNGTTATLSTTDTPGHALFITSSGDWRSSPNDNLWQGVSGTNNPCPSGWRLPTEIEWESERNNGGTGYWGTGSAQDNINGGFTALKLTAQGYRDRIDGNFSTSVGVFGNYKIYTSTGGAASIWLGPTSVGYNNPSARARGDSVRCIKD